MKIDIETARRTAKLAHLEFDEAGLERMAGELTKIMTYIDQLAEVPVDGVAEYGSHATATLRDDVPAPSLPREAVERNAPAWQDGFFVVPKIIGGES